MGYSDGQTRNCWSMITTGVLASVALMAIAIMAQVMASRIFFALIPIFLTPHFARSYIVVPSALILAIDAYAFPGPHVWAMAAAVGLAAWITVIKDDK